MVGLQPDAHSNQSTNHRNLNLNHPPFSIPISESRMEEASYSLHLAMRIVEMQINEGLTKPYPVPAPPVSLPTCRLSSPISYVDISAISRHFLFPSILFTLRPDCPYALASYRPCSWSSAIPHSISSLAVRHPALFLSGSMSILTKHSVYT